jgi:hypothetical protein
MVVVSLMVENEEGAKCKNYDDEGCSLICLLHLFIVF